MFHSSDLSFYITALGCSKNLVDAEKLKGRLVSASFSPAEDPETADILIIITCGFITSAKEESIEVLFDAISQQEEREPGRNGFRPAAVAAGCLTERYTDSIKQEMPELDFVYGIPDDRFVSEMCRVLDITCDSPETEKQIPLAGPLPYRYIKIAEGCSNNCSYCAIPMIRGPEVCYQPEQIMRDIRAAADEGVKEIILIAQDTASYRYGNVTLPDLIRAAAEIPEIQWIRTLYCHPDHITDELIDCIASVPKAVKYMDLPFQHASAKILRSMGRTGSREDYAALVKKIRERIPGVRIRSTFMTGYPGETAQDFNELMSFLKEVRLDRVGAFVYSREEGTPAAGFSGRVSARTAEGRYNRLMELQQQISSSALSEMTGRTVNVLVEEQADDRTFVGRTEFDAPEVDGVFYLTSDRCCLNKIVKAVVTGSAEYDLIGEQIEIS